MLIVSQEFFLISVKKKVIYKCFNRLNCFEKKKMKIVEIGFLLFTLCDIKYITAILNKINEHLKIIANV